MISSGMRGVYIQGDGKIGATESDNSHEATGSKGEDLG